MPDEASGAPCDAYVAEILEYFYDKCDAAHLTAAARAHLERLARYQICYALECSNDGDEDWWENVGRPYWRKTVDKLFEKKFLACPDPDGSLISCRELQIGVNRLTAHTRRAVETGLAIDEIRRFRAVTEGEAPDDGDADVIVPRKWLMMGGCPTMAQLT